MLSKEGASELRNLRSQGFKASLQVLAWGCSFQEWEAEFWCVCHMYPLGEALTSTAQVSLGWFCLEHGVRRRRSKAGASRGGRQHTAGAAAGGSQKCILKITLEQRLSRVV